MFSVLLSLLIACESEQVEAQPEAPKKEASVKAPDPKRDRITGKAVPTLVLSQAWFWTAPDGDDHPGPARLDIWRQTEEGWKNSRLEDPESNVFHKTILLEDGILTIGAMKANLKKWTPWSEPGESTRAFYLLFVGYIWGNGFRFGPPGNQVAMNPNNMILATQVSWIPIT